MRFKKVLSIVVVVAVMQPLLSACDSTKKSKTGDTPGAPKQVTLKLMKMYDWASNPPNWKWGDDPVTKKLTEKTGVTLEIVNPAGNGDEKAAMMLMSGDYPDIMWMDRNSTLQKYIDADALYAIDDLTSKYNCPNLVGNYIPKKVVDMIKNPDGHLYFVPNWYNEHGENGQGTNFMYREDIYKAVGSPKMETLEDYTNYLRKVKELNPNFNGQKVYPIAMSTSYMTTGNLWGEKQSNNAYFDEKDKSVKFGMRSKNVYESAKWWNLLFREGLADPEALTMKADQKNEAYHKGKYAAYFGAFWDVTNYDASTEKVNPDAHFIGIMPPKAVDGVEPHLDGYNVTGWNANVITKNCKDPEAAIKFYDYYVSPEGQRLTFSGVEGVSQDKVVNDVGTLKQNVYDEMMKDWNATKVKYGLRLLDLAQFQKYNWEPSMEVGLRKANRTLTESYGWDATALSLLQLDASTSEGKKWSNISGAMNSTGITKALLAKTEADFHKEYNKVLNDYENMGLKDVEKKWTELYLKVTGNK